MKTNVQIDFDFYVNLEPNGVELICFLGDDEEPVIENITPWDDFIDRAFEWHTIPGQGDTDLLAVDKTANINPVAELYAIIQGLESTADKIRERLEASKILDRGAWVESKDKNRDDYIVDFSYEYMV